MATSIAVLQESIAVDDAAQRALSLVNKFANDYNFCATNPDDVFAELDDARNNVLDAWKTLELAVQREKLSNNNNNDNNNVETTGTTTDFRPAFMDMITDAFGDVLEELRSNGGTGGEEIDVSVLVDCLQSGYDLFVAAANDENDFSWGKLEEEEEEDDDDDENQDDEDDDEDNDNDEEDNVQKA